jgi:putative ABC transport system permease protein
MDSLLQDLRFAARLLRKSPAITAVSVLALTLGIGLTVTMYSIVYGALLRGLPFEDGDRIMALLESDAAQGPDDSRPASLHDYADWREQQRSFTDLAAYYAGTINMTSSERPERYDGAFVTASLLPLLGVQPLLGRGFTAEDDQPGAPYVVLLGHEVWQREFAGDPGVLGRTVRANGEPGTIIGVMPAGFRFPSEEDLWVPLRGDPGRYPRGGGPSLTVIGKLAPGSSAESASADLSGIIARIAAEHPRPGVTEARGRVQPFTKQFIGREATAMLFTMLGAVFLVLLIACANVANLLLSRAALRSKEVGIRTALGATRFRVVVQFLAEAVVLATVGAVLGLGVAWIGITLFNNAIAPTNPPFWIQIRLDTPVLLFVVAVTAIASLVSGAVPAWQAARADVNEILKDESRGGSSFRMGRLSKSLVVLEIALSCGLLVGAGLMIKSVTKLRNFDLGFPAETVFTARVGVPEVEYATPEQQLRFFQDVRERVAAIPGITAAGLTSNLPVTGSPRPQLGIDGVPYADPDRDRPRAGRIAVSPGFFETFETPILAGRDFSTGDGADALPVAIVNESFAARHFPGESPLGRRVQFASPAGAEIPAPWLTVVGVVPDMYVSGVDNEYPEAVYLPYTQAPARFMSIVVRGGPEPLAVTSQVRDAVAAVDADVPLYFVQTLAASIAQNTWFYRVFGTLFMVFGLVALLLAAMGLYAVMSFSVSRRTREVGVRMALGARIGSVVGLIFRQAMVQIAIGLVLGLGLAAAVSRLLTMLLFGVHPRDPVIFGSIVLLLMGTGVIAAVVPARRAAMIEPLAALRQD